MDIHFLDASAVFSPYTLKEILPENLRRKLMWLRQGKSVVKDYMNGDTVIKSMHQRKHGY